MNEFITKNPIFLEYSKTLNEEYGTHNLEGVGDEKTAVRFTVDASKDIVNVNQLTKRLLTRALSADSKD